MNKQRRNQIQKIIDKLGELEPLAEEIKSMIEEVKGEEEDYKDNMPENLQQSERYETAEAAVENLESAYDAMEQIDFSEITGYLEEAMA